MRQYQMSRKYLQFSNSRIAQICLLICIILCLVTAASGGTKTISIPAQSRPLLGLADQLEREYAWRITYEEAPLENSVDLVNGASIGTHWIARPTAFQASFEEPQDFRSLEEKWKILDRLVAKYSGLHGTMAVLSNGDYSHIIPTTLKNKAGHIVPFEPLLNTKVSFEPAQRSLLDTVRLIMSQVSRIRGVSIGLGTIPTNLFVQQQLLTNADDESAREVLMRIFEDASGKRQLKGGPAARVTWDLLNDISYSGYFFNAHIVDPLINESTTQLPAPTPRPLRWAAPFSAYLLMNSSRTAEFRMYECYAYVQSG
jgi:hypothetical protein